MAGTDRRTRAIAAIQTAAVNHNFPTKLTILSERWNTVAQFGDSGIIAKAATLADLARSDPAYWFQLEVDVCAELASRRVAVQEPLLSAVQIVNGVPVTLWHEIDGKMGECTEEQLVQSLARVHEIGANLLGDRQWFATITSHFDDIFPMLEDRQVIPLRELCSLRTHYERLMDRIVAADTPSSFIHGDAQRKNAMLTDEGAVWIDFEEASYGPIAWDLACLTMHRRYDTDRVLDRYAELTGHARIPTLVINVFKQLRDLEGLTWMLAIQDEREPAFATEAASLLQEVLTTATGG